MLFQQIPQQVRDDKVTVDMRLALRSDPVIPNAAEETVKKRTDFRPALERPLALTCASVTAQVLPQLYGLQSTRMVGADDVYVAVCANVRQDNVV